MKASILLMDLCQRGEYTPGLFEAGQTPEGERLMGVIDQVNARWGRYAIRPARLKQDLEWKMQRQHLSPCYTTSLAGLFTAKA